VKLLFDENLSRKLVARLTELYPGSAHVSEFDLLERPDREIWDFALQGDFVNHGRGFLRTRCSVGSSPESGLAPALVPSHPGC
jgi:predicted nuclease of predicted toxin-antitoxin system